MNPPKAPKQRGKRPDYIPEDPHEGIEVRASWGRMLIATTEDIWVPGLSCGARGLALLLAGADHVPTPGEITELTGDGAARIQRWMNELDGTGYLEVED